MRPLSGRNSPLLPVLMGGLAAGTFDILYAMLFWAVRANVPPSRILQSVAAGLLGKASFAGGWKTVALGLFLHFFIAISMSFAYFAVARQWRLIHQRPWSFGALYGLLLYVIMNFVVIPLSAAQRGSTDVLWVSLSIMVHMLLIGIPIALSARRALSR